MDGFDRFAFSASADFDEVATREAFSHAVPLKTLVIYCYDPRAAGIPDAVARLFEDEVYPGEVLLDADGKRAGSTTTIFPVIVAGGRAVDALRSITIAQHLFGIRNIVIVHHSHCGGTSFTADGILEAYRREQQRDISDLYDRSSLCITSFEASLRDDVALVRANAGTPAHANVFGYFYDMDSGSLTEVARDMAQVPEPA